MHFSFIAVDIISTPCTDNSGCYGNLYCIHGTCQCAGEDYWTSNMCSPSKFCHLLLYEINRISGLMVSVLASSAVDRWL
jgi:hypothetical protein